MLGGLLKAGWRSESPEKRCSSILKMNTEDTSNQAIFETLALNDPAQSVRQACIKQLRLPGSLFKVYSVQHDSVTKSAAKTAFCALIGRNSQLSETDFETLLATHSDANQLVAQHCPHPSLRIRVLDKLSQTEQAQAIAEINYVETRLHVAQTLDQIEALEIARQRLKGKDKNAEKVIRAKLEKHRSQQKLENEINDAALDLCEQMEFIANHPEWRSEFKGKYKQYSQRWSALASTPPESVVQRFNSATNTAKLKVDCQTQQENAQQNQQQISDKLEHYCQTLAPLSLNALQNEHLSINAVLGEALATWLENGDVFSPSPELAARFLAAERALSSLSDLIEAASQDEININDLASKLSAINWQIKAPTLFAKTEASDLLAELKRQSSAQKKQNKDNLDALHKRINRLLGTSNKGDIKKARHELSATSKATSHYHGKERKILDERLEMAADIVSKMSDWQNFAIEPKLVELCESMEKLIDTKAHPDKLAKEISTLQNNWKGLGHTDISDQHWLRFKAAADLAYAPCSVFFEQRKITQKDNLAKREPLVSQMDAILTQTDWDNAPDYKQVELSLRNLSNEWRKIKDVDRHAGQKQWDRLVKIRDLIYQKLDLVYDANFEQKQQIIAKVNTLADGTVNDDSLDKLKLFQSRWKQIGITRRKQDQEAWNLFRAAGDRLFDKVKGARNQKRALEDQQIDAYRDIIKEIHSVAKSASNLADGDSEFALLSERYKALPPLPKTFPEKLIERLESEYRRAEEAYSQAHDRLIQASKDDVIHKLREKADLCGELEAAIIGGDNTSATDIKQKLESTLIGDKSLEKRFEARLLAVAEADKSAANKARTLLCIDLEILLGIASPEHDKALRMQIQLDRMKSVGIGQTPAERKQTLAELKLNWLCSPGADPELQAELEKRFTELLSQS